MRCNDTIPIVVITLVRSRDWVIEVYYGEPRWRGPYISEKPTDPWLRPYIYDDVANPPKIISYGADGVPGGAYFDTDLSSADLTFEIPDTPHERWTKVAWLGLGCAALLTFCISVYDLIRL